MATGFSTSHLASTVLGELVLSLKKERLGWHHSNALPAPVQRPGQLPSRDAIRSVVDGVMRALFPLHMGPDDLQAGEEDFYVTRMLNRALSQLEVQVLRELHYHQRHEAIALSEEALVAQTSTLIVSFCQQLPHISRLLATDVAAAYRGDPAATGVDEVLLCYPGTQAIIHHRLAHALHGLGLPLIARMISEMSHSATGIDIHPGASIGQCFFIDHGTGVVIGESCIIGDNVRLYQAVTLGAKRFAVDENGQLEKGGARHPIVEDDVVIYAGATILGRITIGKGAIIGGNVWLTTDVEPGRSVTQASLNRHKEQARD